MTITPSSVAASSGASTRPLAAPSTADAQRTPLRVLHGSDAGTSQVFAERIASDGAQRGFDVRIDALDAGVDDLPADGATVIVTSAYERVPPDSARAFVSWAQGLGVVQRGPAPALLFLGCHAPGTDRCGANFFVCGDRKHVADVFA